MHTRKGLSVALKKQGLSDAATRIVLDATAPARHAMRTRDAVVAARRGARQMRFVSGATPSAREVEILGIALLVLDQYGLGGHMGLEGASTTRVPQFQDLGKGRKQAGDGGAWTAAMKSAADYMFRELKSALTPWHGGEAFTFAPVPPEGGAPSLDWTGLGVLVSRGEILPLRGVELRPWTQVIVSIAVIETALRDLPQGGIYAECGPQSPSPIVDGYAVHFAGSPEDWSAVLDALQDAQIGEDIDAELAEFGEEIDAESEGV